MSTEIVNMFRAIGADVEIRKEKFSRVFEPATGRHLFGSGFGQIGQAPVRVDVRTVDNREQFEVVFDGRGAKLRVVDVDRSRQHLLLAVSNGEAGEAEKFLCGFDERHWFSAAVPTKGVCSIHTALEALMPPAVKDELDREGITGKQRHRRRTEAFVRQGEWFFTPTNRSFKGRRTLSREPLLRTPGGKPHVLEFAHRIGGERVFVNAEQNLTLSSAEFRKLIAVRPDARKWHWEQMTEDPELYARGRVWHPDHATLHLGRWHRVHVNEEHRAPSRVNLKFID